MIREVTTLLMNEKVTYIELQADLWVTLTFRFLHSQSVPWNKEGSLPVLQVPIRLTNIWYGRLDGIMDPLPSKFGWL